MRKISRFAPGFVASGKGTSVTGVFIAVGVR